MILTQQLIQNPHLIRTRISPNMHRPTLRRHNVLRLAKSLLNRINHKIAHVYPYNVHVIQKMDNQKTTDSSTDNTSHKSSVLLYLVVFLKLPTK